MLIGLPSFILWYSQPSALHPKKYLILLILFFACIHLYPQVQPDSILSKLNPQKWSAAIEKKVNKLENKIVAKSQRTLSKLQKQEEKIYRRMPGTKDSVQAKAALTEINNKYKILQDKLKSPAIASVAKQYIPHLDTVSTVLKFLDQNGIGGNIKNALNKASSLQDKFNQAEEIKKFIRERRQQLELLEKLGLVKELKRFNKQAYYYAAQLKEYKEILKDSKKRERKAIELLSQTKLFQDFMRRNSMLASLFRMPGDPNDPAYIASLAGLQTRVQVNNLIQQQIAAGGPNAQAQFQQNMQAAQSQLQQLKNKINQFGHGGSSDDIMPEGFKPNDQKTKSFFKRLEFGTNVQSQRATSFFPVTSDLGLSIGYKLNNISVIGIGASYKMGWGTGWRNIRITQQRAGLRSFIDWKLKGSFWFSGGYEMNYRTIFNSISQLKDLNAWQQSGLVGVSKVVSLKTKVFKKTKLQLLFDYLSFQQVPKTQPIVFRIGYNF